MVGSVFTKAKYACFYAHLCIYIYTYTVLQSICMHRFGRCFLSACITFDCEWYENIANKILFSCFFFLLYRPFLSPSLIFKSTYLFPSSCLSLHSPFSTLLSIFPLLTPDLAPPRLRSVKMEQRKLNDQANTLVDLAKASLLSFYGASYKLSKVELKMFSYFLMLLDIKS